MTRWFRTDIGRALAFFSSWSALWLTACEGGILDVDDSGIVVPADLDEAGPAAIPTLVNGVVGSYHEAVDGVVRCSAMLTDEMILAGTFPTRFQVDARRIQPSNGDLADQVYTPLHRARLQADTTVFMLEARLGEPAFEETLPLLLQGIAIAKLYAGYSRLWLGILQEAEARAGALSLFPVQFAAIVGQARAHLWLGNFNQAAAAALQLPRGFVYRAEYSANNSDQYNGMYTFTWGDTESIRWTVGDGTAGSSAGERWEHLEEFIGLNLLRNRPLGFSALSQAVPVVLQTLYNDRGSDMLMASWVEGALIVAEVAVRSGQTAFAEALLNDLRSDYSLRATLEWGVDPPAAGNLLPEVQLSGDLVTDLKRVADERARELWLTGDRHTTARRLLRDPQTQLDLFPSKLLIGGGDDVAFPIPQIELDNNPNLGGGDACPAGQSAGSWR